MASNSTVLALPNPTTPLAFLPPTLADQFQVSCYVVVAGLSAFVWDWIMSIPEEYKVFRRRRLSVPTVAYILSRVGTLGFCVSATVFQVALVAHCQLLLYILGSFFSLGLSSTSLLFFFRVRAVFGYSKIITGFFGILWVATFGLSILIPFSIDGDHIGPTDKCINTAVRTFASVPLVLNAFNDTLIFLAISLRIISYTIIGESWRACVRSFFMADGLPRVSKGLLQGGQLYYFATIGLSIVFAAMILAPGIPAVYHSMFSVPNLALENAMACRVYQAVKLGFITNQPSTHFGITIPSRSAPEESGHELTFKQPTFHESRSMQVNVDITRTMDRKEYDDHMSGKRASLVAGGSDVYDRV